MMNKNEKTLIEKAQEQGIFLNNYNEGDYRTRCPDCSPHRKKKNDPCLSVTVSYDSILWMCHHCDWSGGVKEGADYKPMQRNEMPMRAEPIAPIPIVSNANHDLSQGSLLWLQNRKISQATAEAFKLFTKDQKLCFPYYLDGDIVNIKSRTKDKKFLQEKNATKCLYNIDMLQKDWKNKTTKSVIFVEGEMDVLALYEAGFKNVVSLPDGAPQTAKFKSDDKRFMAFEHSKWIFEADEVIVATDADENG